MLQQTQVPRVEPAYARFMARFPNVEACARAPQADVVGSWQGLGYNRRAVSLHRCATSVAARYGGRFPDRLDELLALPGLGPYTARAVLAFAFERDVGVVDVNAARVLCRISGAPLAGAALQRRADELVPPGDGWLWNQAMLDLGASICRRRDPGCGACPLREGCAWRRGAGPDPWEGTALARRRQSRFEGSDRQGRSRLLRTLLRGPVDDAGVAAACGWPADADRARRIAWTLVEDRLARRTPTGLEIA